ncbi:MAG: sodium/proton-translocating pyrophosphatase, partial [Candidatus Omnitrophica bacterium]|nr:sodium/proton-translocating pyrophosphatase [Candidatus Omnitrophota bacterium]
MKELLWLAPFGSTLAIVFSIGVIIWMLRKSEGTPQMIQIARAVREGASAYLKRQYKTVAIFFIFAFFILLLLVKYGYLPIFVPFAFVTGGFFSGLSGFVGMKVATQAS